MDIEEAKQELEKHYKAVEVFGKGYPTKTVNALKHIIKTNIK